MKSRAAKTALLALEAQQVIALRLMKIAAGGPAADRESRRMVLEKVHAGQKVAGQMIAATLRGKPMVGADAALRLLHRKVSANRRRLLKTFGSAP
jgi:hypothetical protein